MLTNKPYRRIAGFCTGFGVSTFRGRQSRDPLENCISRLAEKPQYPGMYESSGPELMHRRAGRSTAAVLAALATTITLLGSAPALAAKGGGGGGGGGVPAPAPVPVTQPSLLGDAIVFTMRDFVSISNLKPNAKLIVKASRNGINNLIATAKAQTDANGFVEVNHPGGVCWDKVTPDIVAKDLIQVFYDEGDKQLAAETLTQNIEALQATIVADPIYPEDPYKNKVVVKGKARTPDNLAMNPSLLEVRIINPGFIDPQSGSRIGKREIRADSNGGRIDDANGKPISGTSGTLAFDTADNPTGEKFTATFSGLLPIEQRMVAEGQTRVMGWKETSSTGVRIGMTIYEVGEFGGPGMGGCPPGPGGPVASSAPVSTNLVHYRPEDLVDAQTKLQKGVVTVFPDRDFVSIEGYAENDQLQVIVRRPSLAGTGKPVIGTARGIVGRTGLFEINHPGGICWTGQTPDIAADDEIDVVRIYANETFAEGQTQRVINARVINPAAKVGAQVQVTGVAYDKLGNPLPLDFLEQRIINPDFTTTAIGRRDISADINGGRVQNVVGGSGNLLRTTGCVGASCGWTATYTGLDANEQNMAVAGQSRVLAWLNTFSGVRSGITISEYGEVGGPGMGGCPARGNDAIAMP